MALTPDTLLYGLFAVTIITGAALFFYEPVKVGSHAYFLPKLILTALGLAADAAQMARLIDCACLNVEAEPKVLLR